MKHVLLLVIVAASAIGCGSKKEGGGGGGGGGGTKEVTGTLLVDGKPRTITKCIVERHLDTRITLVFAGGSVSYEDKDLYLYVGDDDDGVMRGSELECSKLRSPELYMGTSTSAPGWVRGTVEAECATPTPVTLDVTLTCGTLSPTQQRQLDELKAETAKPPFGGSTEPAAGSGSGSAAHPAAGSGSAAPAAGSAAP